MTPKTVIFDLGKVLVDFDFTIAARMFATDRILTAKLHWGRRKRMKAE